MQRGDVVFTLLASFQTPSAILLWPPISTQKAEAGFEHQEAKIPLVPPPEKLLSMEELREKRLTDPRLPMAYRNKVARKDFVPWPIEMRFCELNHADRQYQSHPSLKYWFKARGRLSDDLALHRLTALILEARGPAMLGHVKPVELQLWDDLRRCTDVVSQALQS
ncbi:hypothetical protein ACLOJK_024425 [Asimina triloba]